MENFKCADCNCDLDHGFQSNNNLALCFACDEWAEQKITDEADQRQNGKTNLD